MMFFEQGSNLEVDRLPPSRDEQLPRRVSVDRVWALSVTGHPLGQQKNGEPRSEALVYLAELPTGSADSRTSRDRHAIGFAQRGSGPEWENIDWTVLREIDVSAIGIEKTLLAGLSAKAWQCVQAGQVQI